VARDPPPVVQGLEQDGFLLPEDLAGSRVHPVEEFAGIINYLGSLGLGYGNSCQ